MRRLTLDPDTLEVVSFDPAPALGPEGAQAGTLVGLSCVGISCEVNCATVVGRPC